MPPRLRMDATYYPFPDVMPARLRLLLIEAEDYFEFTRQCSPAVEKAIDGVETMIYRHLDTAPTSGLDLPSGSSRLS